MHYNDATPPIPPSPRASSLPALPSPHALRGGPPPAQAATVAPATPEVDDDGEAFLGPRVVVHLGEAPKVGLQWARREPLTHVRPLPEAGLDALLAEVLRYLERHPYVRPAECAIRGVPRHDGAARAGALRLPVDTLRSLAALARAAGPGTPA